MGKRDLGDQERATDEDAKHNEEYALATWSSNERVLDILIRAEH